MAVLTGFAFLSGIVTILSPCILPLLPIVLAAGAGRGKARPLGVITGFAASFTIFTLALTAIVGLLGIPADALRIVAVVLIVLAGLTLLVPRLRDGFELLASRLVRRAPRASTSAGPAGGFLGGLPLGLGLGLVWTPCVGPIMASVISVALTRRVDGGAAVITAAYAVGTSLPMLGVMLGGRALLDRVPALARNAARVQRVLGVLAIAVGVAVGFGWDRRFQSAVLAVFPGYGVGLTAIENTTSVKQALAARSATQPRPATTMMAAAGAGSEGGASGAGHIFAGGLEEPADKEKLGSYGRAPDIVTDGSWFNTAGRPLTMEALKGKVVLVDFWTYSCVNCVRTIPYLRGWYDAYRDKGLVIVGVHSPEFEFEKSSTNVARAIADLGVTWPVVQDNAFAQWNAYGNQYWPAHYFIDAQGTVRSFHFGEGDYDVAEKVIRALLTEAGVDPGKPVSARVAAIEANTPETYLGYLRGSGLVSPERPLADNIVDYTSPRSPANGEWALAGRWTVSAQYIEPESTGTLELGFQARDVFLVIEPDGGAAQVRVQVDGKSPKDTPDVKGGTAAPTESRLYHLVSLNKAGSHVLRLEIMGRLRLFAFTFG